MFLIESGKLQRLDVICNEYWKKLNKTKPSGAYHDNALKKKITRAFRTETDKKLIYFYGLLARDKWGLLKELVCAKPERLLKLSQEMDQRIADGHIPRFYEIVDGLIKATDEGTKVMNIFNYKGLRGSNTVTWLSQSLDLPICPYCNYENTISIIRQTTNKAGKVTIVNQHLFEYDHFMIKSIYPYLSASFWNLVPSCHICNSNLKGFETFVPGVDIHPYTDDLSKTSLFTIGGIPAANATHFSLEFTPRGSVPIEVSQVKRYNEVFQIEQRYKNFQADITYLNAERNYYDDTSKENLLNNGFTALSFADMKEVVSHIASRVRIPLTPAAALRQSKGKLIMDLASELEITTYKGVAP